MAESRSEDAQHPGSTSEGTWKKDRNTYPSVRAVDWIAGVGDISSRASRDGQNRDATQIPRCAENPGFRAQHVATSRQNHHISRSQSKRTALQRHCDFWDADHDGLIYPIDIYIGFRKLGFNIVLCFLAAISMAFCTSYSTQASWLPHPLFAINLDNIHRSRHGSTTATYDLDHEIDMRRFGSIFTKYAAGEDYLTMKTLYNVWAGQCVGYDCFGRFAGGLECRSS
jgi:peroxygenase